MMFDNAFGCVEIFLLAVRRSAPPRSSRFFCFFSIFLYRSAAKKPYIPVFRASLLYTVKRCSPYSRALTSSSAHPLSLRLAVGFAYAPSALRRLTLRVAPFHYFGRSPRCYTSPS